MIITLAIALALVWYLGGIVTKMLLLVPGLLSEETVAYLSANAEVASTLITISWPFVMLYATVNGLLNAAKGTVDQ